MTTKHVKLSGIQRVNVISGENIDFPNVALILNGRAYTWEYPRVNTIFG